MPTALPAVPRRNLGNSGQTLSALTFGSMRMLERGLDAAAWRQLLAEAHARGVTTFHSSDEYESFPCFAEVWHGLRSELSGPVQHVVKLAEPHFGHDQFDAGRLNQRVDQYLSALRVERIDVVQWMWRGDLKDEPTRLARLQAQLPEIAAAVAALQKTGKIGVVTAFPYTSGCAELLLDQSWNQGFTLYLNPLELEMLPFLEKVRAAGAGTIALRPLAAGRMAEAAQSPSGASQSAEAALAGASQSAGGALAWALAQSGVCTGVVSFSSLPHLDQLLEAFR